MERYFMDDFKIEISLDQLTDKLHLTEEEDIELMGKRLKEALEIARPKAIYRLCKIDQAENGLVIIEGTEFQSETLAGHLKDVHHVFAYAVTCGTEVDAYTRKEQDYIVNLWLDILKEMILKEAAAQFRKAISTRFEIPRLSSMSPGSGNLDTWPITQQKQLFSLIGDVTASTGIELTESCLMHPTKSISGVLFPSDKEFITCSLCKRPHCQNRKSPYKDHAAH